MTTLKLFGFDLGPVETVLVRCNLAQASAPVEASYDGGKEWCGTPFQCADARHTNEGLARIGKILAAQACEMDRDEFDCDWEEMEDWTHIFREAGNGYPQDGDLVACDGEVLRLVRTSPIHTEQWKANYVYCVCQSEGGDGDASDLPVVEAVK